MNQPVQVLGRKPKELEWNEHTVTTLEDMQAMVEGRIDCIELEHGIDLYVNDEFLSFASGNTINLLIRDEEAEYSMIVFGNVFLASHGDEGEMTSLSAFQKEWILSRTEVLSYIGYRPTFRLDIRSEVA